MRSLRFIATLGALVAMGQGLTRVALAQHQPSAIGTRLRDYGLFAGLDLRFGDVAGDFGAFVGGHAAILLKHRVYLGVGGAGLATENALHASASQATPEPVRMGYGGLILGVIVPTPSLIQVSAEVLLGAGGVNANRDGDAAGGDDMNDAIFVFEPGATVEVKLASFARIGVGVGYRFIGDLDLPGMRDADLRGVTGVATIRVGKF